MLRGNLAFMTSVAWLHPGMPQGRWCVPRRRRRSLAPLYSQPHASPAVEQPLVEQEGHIGTMWKN